MLETYTLTILQERLTILIEFINLLIHHSRWLYKYNTKYYIVVIMVSLKYKFIIKIYSNRIRSHNTTDPSFL